MKAVGEPIRLLFHYANVEFEDIRVSNEEWAKMKSEMPWNLLPVLVVDGKHQLSQCLTIFRYLAREFGLVGADEFETAKCNEYIDAMDEVRLDVLQMFRESDPAKKAAIKKNVVENTFPKAWPKFNGILKRNGTGFLVGEGVTCADIYVAYMVDLLTGFVEFSTMSDYPELDDHRKKILNLPGIKEWIATRPYTAF
ncbi:Glutathione S-transferase [Folsomia candida]|uniref:glutathione transferase n=2 Tax=Folsomia candida TaxID=158441 RepID=A0A226CX75_FOLCA|nr:Glutathione S-transferase [Folsomia candida]